MMSVSNLRRSKREHVIRKHSLSPSYVSQQKAGTTERKCESTDVDQPQLEQNAIKVYTSRIMNSQLEINQTNASTSKRLDARRYRQAFSAKFKGLKKEEGGNCLRNQASDLAGAVGGGIKEGSQVGDQVVLCVKPLDKGGRLEDEEQVVGSETGGSRECTEAGLEKNSERREFTYFSRKRKHLTDQQQDGRTSETTASSPVKGIGGNEQTAGQRMTEFDGSEGRQVEDDQQKKGQIRRSSRRLDPSLLGNTVGMPNRKDMQQDLVEEDCTASESESKEIHQCKISEDSNGTSSTLQNKEIISDVDSILVARDDDLQMGGCKNDSQEKNLKSTIEIGPRKGEHRFIHDRVDACNPSVNSNHGEGPHDLLEETVGDEGLSKNRGESILDEVDPKGNPLDGSGMNLVVSVPIRDKIEMCEHGRSENEYTGEWVQCIDCKKWRRLDSNVQVTKEAWRCNDNICDALHATCSASQEPQGSPVGLAQKEGRESSHFKLSGQVERPVNTVQEDKTSGKLEMDRGANSTVTQKQKKSLCKEIGGLHSFHAPLEECGHEGKMELKSTIGEEVIEIEEDVDIDALSPAQVSCSEGGAQTDSYNNVCQVCKEGGELLCCDGKDCLVTYHLACLNPPLTRVPPGDWYCPTCAYKRVSCGVYSVCGGIESIWDVKEAEIEQNELGENITEGYVSFQGEGSEHVSQPGTDCLMLTMVQREDEGLTEKSSWSFNNAGHDELSDNTLYKLRSDKVFKRPKNQEKQYLVKYRGLAHLHNCWVSESKLMKEAPKQLANFKKKLQQGKAMKWNPEWAEPHRLIQKRFLLPPKQLNEECRGTGGNVECGIEWCVKWKGLGYDHCTWELEDLNVLSSSSAKELMKSYELRSEEARQRASSGRAVKANKLRNSAFSRLKKLPDWMKGGLDSSHLKSVNKLREFWQNHKNALVVDEVNQERMVTTISFILSLIKEFEVIQPILIVTSSALISSWESEFVQLASFVNTVVYYGNRDSRKVIQKHEFHEENGCVMVQIVLSTLDVVTMDLDFLIKLEWEALIIDECQRLKFSKVIRHLENLRVDFRLLLFTEQLKENVAEFSHMLAFLDAEKKILTADTSEHHQQDSSEDLAPLKDKLTEYIVYERKSDPLSSSNLIEHWVPVELTNVQLEQYCTILISNMDSLCSVSKKNDSVGGLRDVLLSLRKCCNHPYLVDVSLHSSLTEGLSEVEFLDIDINASGKLQLLDNILSELRSIGQRVLILFQMIGRSGGTSIGDILDDHIRQRFGVDSYERVDGGLATTKKQAALQMFNSKDTGRFVFLLEKRACGASIKLSSIDTVIIFDSDWNPLNDLRALQKVHIDTPVEHLKVFRFYSPYTIEERVLISAKQEFVLDNHLENFSAAVCQMLLKWGCSHLFEKYEKHCDLNSSNRKPLSLSNNETLKSLAKDMLTCACHGPELDDAPLNVLIPRVSRTGGYGKGAQLLGESDDCPMEEKVPSNIFWTKLLKGRRIEKHSVGGLLQRPRRKVQYYEGSTPKSVSDPDEIEAKRKRRKVSGTLDPISISSWLKDAKKSLANGKDINENSSEAHAYGGNQASNESIKDDSGKLSHLISKKSATDMLSGKHPSPCSGSCDVDIEIAGSDGETINGKSFREITDGGYHSSSIVAEDTVRSKSHNPSSARGATSAATYHGHDLISHGVSSHITNPEGFATESEDGKALRLVQQSLHSRINPELVKLCKILQFTVDVTQMAEEFLAHVMNNYRLPKEPKSLLQAVEISLCLAAAGCLKYEMDLEASLELAKLHLNFECRREEVDSVYLKLREQCLNLRRDIPFHAGQTSSRGDPSPVYSTSQQHAGEMCSQDDRVSTSRNDDNTNSSMQTKSNQAPFSLQDSPGLDDHQPVTVHITDDANAREHPSMQFQTGSEMPEQLTLEAAVTSNSEQVEKGLNRHTEQDIVDRAPSQEDITLIDPMEVADSPFDPEPQLLSEDQLDFLSPGKIKLMKEKIQARKQEQMHILLRKQQTEVSEFFKRCESERKKLEARQNMECSSIRTIYTNPEVRDAKLKEEKELHAQILRELEERLKKELDDLKTQQSAFREKENRKYATFMEHINAGKMSRLLSDVIEPRPNPKVLEPLTHSTTSEACEPQEITLWSAAETERLISVPTLEQQQEANAPPSEFVRTLASAQTTDVQQNQSVDAQTVSHLNQLPRSATSLQRSRSRLRTVVPYQWHPVCSPNSQQQQHPNQQTFIQQDTSPQSMGTREPQYQVADFSNSHENQRCMQSLQPSDTHNSQTEYLDNTPGCSPTSIQLRPIESLQPLQQMDMYERSSSATETAAVAYGLSRVNESLQSLQSAPAGVNSAQIRTPTSSRGLQANFPDPLYHEMLRIRKEQDRIKKLHEEETTRIKVQFEKELEELKRRYAGLLQEEECAFAQRKKILETNFIKVDMNRRLAEAFKIKVHDNNSTAPLAQSGPIIQSPQLRQQATPATNIRLPQLVVPAVHSGSAINVTDVSTSCSLSSFGGMVSLQGGNTHSNEAWTSGLQFSARRFSQCLPLQSTQLMQGTQSNALPHNLTVVSDISNRNFQHPVCSSVVVTSGYLTQNRPLQTQGNSGQVISNVHSSDATSIISQRLQQHETGQILGSPNRASPSSGAFHTSGLPLCQNLPNFLYHNPVSSANANNASSAMVSSDVVGTGTQCAADFVAGSSQSPFPLQLSLAACPFERIGMPQVSSSNLREMEISSIVENINGTDTQHTTQENVLEDSANIGVSFVYGNNASDPCPFTRGETPGALDLPEGQTELSHSSLLVPAQGNCNNRAQGSNTPSVIYLSDDD